MSRKARIGLVALVVVALGAVAAVVVQQRRSEAVEVRLAAVEQRDLVATVTASGNVRARRTVDISADVMGRVTELNVEEGDEVSAGEVLLRLDPTQFRAAASRARAALSQAEAQRAEREASVLRARRSFERVETLWSRDSTLVSEQQLDEARTNLEVARAQLTAAEHGVEQARAALEEAEDQLEKTVLRAPIGGTVTRLNIELGETAVVGTMNNPGSLLLTVSDLSVVEAVLEVDETDVPEVTPGDSAVVEIDAFPDRVFTGRVTKIGNSAIRPPGSQTGGGQATAIDFEVVVTLDDPPVLLRPDLSATADIVTATRANVLAIPIIALTIRDLDADEGDAAGDAGDGEPDGADEGPLARSRRPAEEEGVFLLRDGTAAFRPVTVGIAGQEYFEVVSGLSRGDTVVAGPYQRIRELSEGDAIRALERDEGDEAE